MSEPTKVETLKARFRQRAVHSIRGEGVTSVLAADLRTQESHAVESVLTAFGEWYESLVRIPGPACETCHGSGLRQDIPYEGDPACPTCHGEQRVSVVTAETWGTAVRDAISIIGATLTGNTRDKVERALIAALTALLPGVERAREVGVLQVPTGARLANGRPITGCWLMKWDSAGPLPREIACGEVATNREGDRMALLIDKEVPGA